MKKMDTRKLVLSGVFLALGLVLPFITGQVQEIGSMLLPMHIPVLLCGFVCGAPYGILVGFITPLLRSAIFSMPPLFPKACSMAFELAAYGFLAGFCYQKLSDKKPVIRSYGALILAMLGGRIVWAVATKLLYSAIGMNFTMQLFFAEAFVNAMPGIVLQLILIPVLLLAFRKARYME